MRFIAAVGVFVLCGFQSLQAQPERYDVGRRLIAFEEAWDRQPDSAARRRAIPHMKNALSNFFASKYSEAGRHLDFARHSLKSELPTTPEIAWADSLSFCPQKRLIDLGDGEFKLDVRRTYEQSGFAGQVDFRVSLCGEKKCRLQPQEDDKKFWALPQCLCASLGGVSEGDHCIDIATMRKDQVLAQARSQISVAKNLESRLQALRDFVATLPTSQLSTEQSTLTAHVGLLQRLARGGSLETEYPAHRLLCEAETLAKLPRDECYFNSSRTGQFWMTLTTKQGEAPVRLFVPANAAEAKPLPVVVAMHGAGGTENMFFDAYGHGEIVRQCEKRGWLLVAPRANFIGNAPVAGIIDELAKRYPVDEKRVYLIGHSMGAGQAMALAQQMPERWAGVAALGGTGRVSKPSIFAHLPLFVGCGIDDFALPGARSVANKLSAIETRAFVNKEYPDIEHILIVQVALPDVFSWLESLSPR